MKKSFLPEIDENALTEAMQNVDAAENPFQNKQDFLEPVDSPEMPKAPYQNELLNVRETTHGDYRDTARIAQRLKDTLLIEQVKRTKRGQSRLTDTQKECLDLIMTKVARIIAGQASNQEHWDDIAGYANLARSDA